MTRKQLLNWATIVGIDPSKLSDDELIATYQRIQKLKDELYVRLFGNEQV